MLEQPNDVEEEQEEEEEGIPFFPNHLLKEVIAVYLVVGILLTLAIFLPFGLHGKADPLSTPEGIKPEWYFLWVYQALKYFPSRMGFVDGKTVGMLVIFVVIGFTQFAWPILDNDPERHPSRRRAAMWLVTSGLLIGMMFMLLGVLSERTLHVAGKTYHFDLRGIPHEAPVNSSASAELQEGVGSQHGETGGTE